MANWKFDPISYTFVTNPNVDEGFQNEDVDLLRALGREPAQNTADAPAVEGEVVDLIFTHVSLDETNDDVQRLWSGLQPHLAANNLGDDVDFTKPHFLLVEDMNTTGIEGDPIENSPDSDWHGFFWRLSKSGKGGVKGGRRGLGRSVFAISSKLRCFYALTKRVSDPDRELMMGISLMENHECEDGQMYAAVGTYGVDSDKWIQPVTDQDYISRLKSILNMQRNDESGTSIIIPFPSDEVLNGTLRLQQEVVRNYLVPIMRSQIRFSVDGMQINRDTISDLMPNLFQKKKSYVDDFSCFVDECYSGKAPTCVLDLPMTKPPSRLEKTYFDEAQLTTLKDGFEAGEFIRLDVSIMGQRVNKAPEQGIGSFCLKKTKDGKKGEDYYIRGNMPVLGESKFRSSPVFGLFYSDDPFLVELLGDSEGGNHNIWNSRHPYLKKNYSDYYNAVLLCKNGLESLLRILIDSDSEEDTKTFADFFPIASESGATGHSTGAGEQSDEVDKPPCPPMFIDEEDEPEDDDNQEDEESDTDVITPQTPTSPFKVTKLTKDSGFVVRASKIAIDQDFPLKLGIRVAYDIEGRDPFKQYRKSSFSFDGPQRISISDTSISIEKYDGNYVVINAAAKDFEFKVTGFDRNRDLVVRVTKEK